MVKVKGGIRVVPGDIIRLGGSIQSQWGLKGSGRLLHNRGIITS